MHILPTVVQSIRIDGPGDGAWIMSRVGGSPFIEGYDHSLMTVREGRPIGGFVLCNYAEASIFAHLAGEGRRWMSRDLIWICYDYVFNQLGCAKFIVAVNTAFPAQVEMAIRLGFIPEARILGAHLNNGDMLFLSQTRAQCRWLDKPSKNYARSHR